MPEKYETLYLPDLDHLIPVELSEKDYVIFINDIGEELKLKLEYSKKLITQHINLEEYEAEKMTISYIDTTTIIYSCEITVLTSYQPQDHIDVSLFSMLKTTENSGYIPWVILEINGEVRNGIPLTSYTVANRTFENVVISLDARPEFTRFSKLIYSSALGIVGFEGDNEMWAFDRFE